MYTKVWRLEGGLCFCKPYIESNCPSKKYMNFCDSLSKSFSLQYILKNSYPIVLYILVFRIMIRISLFFTRYQLPVNMFSHQSILKAKVFIQLCLQWINILHKLAGTCSLYWFCTAVLLDESQYNYLPWTVSYQLLKSYMYIYWFTSWILTDRHIHIVCHFK